MKYDRPYQMTVRAQVARSGNVYPLRARTFSTRTAAEQAAVREIAARIAEDARYAESQRGRGITPQPAARWDALIFGPDRDLRGGRLYYADGTSRDLGEVIDENARTTRELCERLGINIDA